jgi:hypothetical protein
MHDLDEDTKILQKQTKENNKNRNETFKYLQIFIKRLIIALLSSIKLSRAINCSLPSSIFSKSKNILDKNIFSHKNTPPNKKHVFSGRS